jgi:hypothetical protein
MAMRAPHSATAAKRDRTGSLLREAIDGVVGE